MSIPSNAWFDTFRDRGPVLFDGINRTPAIEDVRNVLIYISFSTLFVAFLIIFPGIRKERVSTFICVTVSLFLGAVILVANFGTNWHVAQASISSPYRAFSRDKIFARVAVRVGLQSVNITLQALPLMHSRSEEINYNERFYWIDPTEMKLEHKKALAKGLPFPILTIAEYLSQDGEGFCWGRRYRLSGYYASILLWAAFCSWLLMNILLCAVPRYGVYCMQLTGMLMLSTNAIYAILLPKKPLVIPFENEVLSFEYGWSFWVVLMGGGLAVLVGAVVSILDTLFPNKFSTILEIDYDTPYRYFVGNDAHLFGHSAGSCPHSTATATSSTATETTCCGGLHGETSLKKKPVRKMKSDASTSTVMSIPIKKGFGDIISDATVSSTSSARMITRAKIENNNFISSTGITNGAFEGEDNDDYHDSRSRSSSIEEEVSASQTDHDYRQLHSQQKETSRKISTASKKSKSAKEESDEVESDASDVSTTIIDGKRAISLHNFGKFTAQQQQQSKRKDSTASTTNTTVLINNNISSNDFKLSSSRLPVSSSLSPTSTLFSPSPSSSSSTTSNHPNRFTTLNVDLNY